MLAEKIETGIWFARRPDYWSHAAALVCRKFQTNRDTEADNVAARKWASQRAVPIARALVDVGLLADADAQVPRLPREIISQAEIRAERAEVKMGGPGDLDLIYAAVQLTGASRAVETGVAYGWSSLAILSAFSDLKSSRLVSVDMPYPKMGNERWVGIAVADELRSSWTLMRQPDRRGLDHALAILGGVIDFAHFDSDKSYQGRMYAYPRMWRALRPGGVFISDDIQDNFGFRDFVTKARIPFSVTESQGKFVGIAVKPVDGKNGE